MSLSRRWSPTAAALLALAPLAPAQFVDDMEAYATGPLEGQGCWHPGSGGAPTPFAQVTDSLAFSGSQCVRANAGADTVHEFTQFTEGQWTLSVMTFIPSALNGRSFVIGFNDYTPGGPVEYGLSVAFNGLTDRVECDCGSTSPSTRPLVYDSWRELRAEIDLDGDLCRVFYDGALVGQYTYSQGIFGLDSFGQTQFDSICLFPDTSTNPNVSEVYYDDLRIVPSSGRVGTGICFGDGSGTPCPCANAGCASQGCANSSGSGGHLSAWGSESVGADDLSFEARNLLPNQPVLLFVGENAIAGGDGVTFGDGLRCAGMNVERLGVRVPDSAGEAAWGPGLAASGGWGASDTRHFQAWYRDPQGSPCGAGFNLTQAVSITFTP